ncbi:DNA polymerase IV [Rummeliibacillus stabekisii]|uniref:DNA polymerase IV n=1 Tax=Rummeliibacillus stabekisii TaxID=241244 RepID=A0A143HAZ6_9BACL|nr:DNA polymerase IV [Rummeliibacillus stabekisii]AMW98882.1 DNA polymerase IV [Rummeliibacillus stabekisii]
MNGRGRIIFHIDMNSFYASVEQAYHPELKGKPVAIAGNPSERKGILVTCSYEARAKGIFTTMAVWEAKRQCPNLIVLPPNFERYRHASKAMFDILRSYTDLVEPVSIDEGYVDVTEIAHGIEAIQLAKMIQTRILHELDLPCSIGIAPNKFLAKTASDMKKPMGITILRKRDVEKMLWHLPVIEMHGVGSSTSNKLKEIGIATIGDLARSEDYLLKANLGKNGLRLKNRAQGIDQREVDPNSIYDTKSVGHSMTFPSDLMILSELQTAIEELCMRVAKRLDAKKLAGHTVSILFRDADWHNYTRSKTSQNAIFKKKDIEVIALSLIEKHWNGNPVRLLGVTVSNVVDQSDTVEQLSLFTYEKYAKEEPIRKVVEELQYKFGKDMITKGIKHAKKPTYESKTSFSKDFLDDHRERG